MIPTLETARLRLRPLRRDDLPALTAILGEAKVMEYSDNGPLGITEQKAWLDRKLAAKGGDGPDFAWAIEPLLGSGAFGYISLAGDQNRLEPGEAELGFRLAHPAWGQGFATEAASAVVELASILKGINHLVAIVDPHNAASIRVLEKLGLSKTREVMFDGYAYPDHVYARRL